MLPRARGASPYSWRQATRWSDGTAGHASIREARQHEVDDIARHVVIAPGDEDLLARDAVATCAIGLSPRLIAPRSDPACGSVSS